MNFLSRVRSPCCNLEIYLTQPHLYRPPSPAVARMDDNSVDLNYSYYKIGRNEGIIKDVCFFFLSLNNGMRTSVLTKKT